MNSRFEKRYHLQSIPNLGSSPHLLPPRITSYPKSQQALENVSDRVAVIRPTLNIDHIVVYLMIKCLEPKNLSLTDA